MSYNQARRLWAARQVMYNWRIRQRLPLVTKYARLLGFDLCEEWAQEDLTI